VAGRHPAPWGAKIAVGDLMLQRKRKGPRGLAAIAQNRGERSAGSKWTTQAGLVAAGAVIAGLVAHKIVGEHELNADREALLAKQRAVVATLGTEWYPLRNDLEGDVLGAAKEYRGDFVGSQAGTSSFRTRPGLYLRMRVAESIDAQSVRKVAADAKKDAFAACLLREPNERGLRGEVDGGAFAEQPWNLGQAYAATRILTEDWVQAVKDADEDLRMRVFVEQYDKAVREEIPLAIEVIKRAEFFLLVLDEDVPEATALADGGPITEDALQLVEHPARVSLFDLRSKTEIVRLRRSAGARVISAGERVVTDEETRAAVQRQANNCALARQVEAALATQTAGAGP
jgi:hypothetical protein